VLGARDGGAAQFLHAPREPVAGALKGFEAEQRRTPRPGGRAPRGMLARRNRGDVREAGGDDRRKLALEAGDLGAQRVSRGPLGGDALGLERGAIPSADVLLALHQSVSSGRGAHRHETRRFAGVQPALSLTARAGARAALAALPAGAAPAAREAPAPGAHSCSSAVRADHNASSA
jgi:hypothetical protein